MYGSNTFTNSIDLSFELFSLSPSPSPSSSPSPPTSKHLFTLVLPACNATRAMWAGKLHEQYNTSQRRLRRNITGSPWTGHGRTSLDARTASKGRRCMWSRFPHGAISVVTWWVLELYQRCCSESWGYICGKGNFAGVWCGRKLGWDLCLGLFAYVLCLGSFVVLLDWLCFALIWCVHICYNYFTYPIKCTHQTDSWLMPCHWSVNFGG